MSCQLVNAHWNLFRCHLLSPLSQFPLAFPFTSSELALSVEIHWKVSLMRLLRCLNGGMLMCVAFKRFDGEVLQLGKRQRCKIFWEGNSEGVGGMYILLVEKRVDKVIEVVRVWNWVLKLRLVLWNSTATINSGYTPLNRSTKWTEGSFLSYSFAHYLKNKRQWPSFHGWWLQWTCWELLVIFHGILHSHRVGSCNEGKDFWSFAMQINQWSETPTSESLPATW